MAKRKRTTAERIVGEAIPTFAGLSVMGEAAKLVPAAGAKPVATAYGAMGLASTGMMLTAAKGVLGGLEDLNKSVAWKKKRRR